MFQNLYSDQHTMKVCLDDYDAIIRMYKEMYVAYSELRGTPVLSGFADTAPPKLFLETLLLHRFNELSMMRDYSENSYFKIILRNTLDIFDRFGLISNSGAIGYIGNFCAQQLKDKILGQQ